MVAPIKINVKERAHFMVCVVEKTQRKMPLPLLSHTSPSSVYPGPFGTVASYALNTGISLMWQVEPVMWTRTLPEPRPLA